MLNALRGQLAEFGLVAPKGPASLKLLEAALAKPDVGRPGPVCGMGARYPQQIGQLTEIIEQLADELDSATKTDEALRRLCTMPRYRARDGGRKGGSANRRLASLVARKPRMAAAVEAGPKPDIDGVVRWRLVDLVQWAHDELGISVSHQTLGRELCTMGFRKLSARSRHSAQDAEAIAAFKKTSVPSSLTSTLDVTASRWKSGSRSEP